MPVCARMWVCVSERNRGPEEERPWGPACLTACFPAVARAQEDPVFLCSPLRIIATLKARNGTCGLPKDASCPRLTPDIHKCEMCEKGIDRAGAGNLRNSNDVQWKKEAADDSENVSRSTRARNYDSRNRASTAEFLKILKKSSKGLGQKVDARCNKFLPVKRWRGFVPHSVIRLLQKETSRANNWHCSPIASFEYPWLSASAFTRDVREF